MGNNTTESKLDATVKDTLNNYEGNFDTGDWSRMESMLNAAPKTASFSWSTPLTIIIGIAIIGGGYLIFKNVKSSAPSANTTVEAPQPSVTPAPEKVTVTPPAVTKTETPVISTPVATELPPVKAPDTKEKTVIAPPIKTTETINANSTALTSKEKTKKDKNTGKGNQTVSVMGNDPVFGDMIDSSKGIIHETKEKEKTKKAAKSTSNTPISWGLLNQNIDSLKKQQNEQIKKDSVK